MNEIINELREENARLKAQGWIDINDRLPPPGVECLFFRPLATRSNDPCLVVKTATDFNNSCWPLTVPHGAIPMNYSSGACHTSHWMHLPEPPKELEK